MYGLAGLAFGKYDVSFRQGRDQRCMTGKHCEFSGSTREFHLPDHVSREILLGSQYVQKYAALVFHDLFPTELN